MVSNTPSLTRTCCLGLILSFALTAVSFAQTVQYDEAEMAGVSGFPAYWDRPVVVEAEGATRISDHGRFGKGDVADWSTDEPGAPVFDAVHRSLLVRFPGVDQQIAEQLASGKSIEKIELVLPFRDTEYFPMDYALPAGMSFLGDKWVKRPPRWHAVGYLLRQPWKADREIGPTFNAHIHGAGYWDQYGAQDPETDRFDTQFGPSEVSFKQPQGRMDLTAVVEDSSYGETLGERLAVLANQGVLLRKWEIYDASYWSGGYEWAVATGPRGIMIGHPSLEVSFKDGAKQTIDLVDAPDISRLASELRESGEGGRPTAEMPTPEEIEQFADQHRFQQPDWMPDWQWKHVEQLKELGAGRHETFVYPDTPEAYEAWIQGMMALAPRRWQGFSAIEMAQDYMRYSDTWPEPVKDHWKLYWWAWLMPFRENSELVQGYIGGKEAQKFYEETGDWRGNFSVYRTYCRAMGTMNFNHWAAAGTLLGGAILSDEFIIGEGRHGLERFPLRLWSWHDGSTQESIDHYYFAHSLTAQKAFADYGPERIDRMMGRMILAKSIEELSSAFHPNLRRFISPSQRTGIAYLTNTQEGLQYVLHTLSKEGTLTDVETADELPNDLTAFGHQFSPEMAAEQTVNGPWAPAWVARMVDDKPLPYRSTVTFKKWGGFNETPLFRQSYLGEHYGMASIDVAANNETVPVMAQWRREAEKVDSALDLGTMILKFGINQTNLLDTMHVRLGPDGKVVGQNPNGSTGTQGGFPHTLQHDNKMIVLTTPLKGLPYDDHSGDKSRDHVRSLQTTMGLLSLQESPTWKLYVDGQPVETLPVEVSDGQVITIQDGVSYLGVIPIPARHLERTQQTVITDQTGPLVPMQGGGQMKPALLIEQYLYQWTDPAGSADTKADVDDTSPVGMEAERKASEEVDLAYGGFVIEMGDEAEHGSFDQFQQHMRQTALQTQWDEQNDTVDVSYRSGHDKLALTFNPQYNRENDTTLAFPERSVNGNWPYLPQGIERDTTLTRIGRTGTLENNGATLITEPGQMAYIQTLPQSHIYAVYNPFPDPTLLRLQLPGGGELAANGRLGIAAIRYHGHDDTLVVEHATRNADADRDDLADALVLSGIDPAPVTVVNGQEVSPTRATRESQSVWVVPLEAGDAPALDAMLERWSDARELLEKLDSGEAEPGDTVQPR